MFKLFKPKTNTVSSITNPKPKRRIKIPKVIKKIFIIFIISLVILVAGMLLGQKYSLTSTISKLTFKISFKPMVKEDPYILFSREIFDLIKNNYWDSTMNEGAIASMYKIAIDKLTNTTQPLTSPDQKGVELLIADIIKPMTEEQKKNFLTQLADVMLSNLKPFGRSRLYVEKQITDLGNQVRNVEPGHDLYADIGVSKSSPQQDIQKAYDQKVNELKTQPQTQETQQKLATLQKAYDTVGDENARKTYDDSGVQSTVSYRQISPRIAYMKLLIFSPTTLQDINRAATALDKGTENDTLIFDLRDNVGGLIDGLPYFLGPFIGYDQYAYQFFGRGKNEDFKTKIGWLPGLQRYKKVIFLTNGACQSSTEVFAVTMKKYNVGVIVGTKTKGWGTIEKIESLKNQPFKGEKYSVLLVEQLTLREDGQSIEGLGVDPNISIADKDWENQLYKRFNSQEIVTVVKDLLKSDIAALPKAQ